MSFAGHAWDMMKRTQENRARLKESRESSKDARKKYSQGKTTGLEPTVTAEEFAETNRQIKKRDIKEHHFHMWTLFIFAIVGFGLLFLFIWLTR